MHRHLRSVRVLLPTGILLLAGFAAAPASSRPADDPFFFLQLSDPQFGMFTKDKDFSQETANFEFAIATANRLKPAFVIVTGDLVNKAGDAAQIAEYRRIAAKLDRAIPLYNVAGNHDVENTPSPETVAAYVRMFGPDHYVFRVGSLAGIVLNSSLISAPANAPELAAAQRQWLESTLSALGGEHLRHIVVFQHHPWFLSDSGEADQYYNIPRERRGDYLALFHRYGVRYLFSGHYHRNALAKDGEIEMITTGPVGMPLGGAKSGLGVGIVRDDGIEHRYYELSELPASIDLARRGSS